jgi:hypothetical protein
VKRFIQHEELARDSRFIRQQNVAGKVLASLPDDVDAIVEAFEKLEPVIDAGTRGTAAEPLLDEYGVAFTLITLNEPPGSSWVSCRRSRAPGDRSGISPIRPGSSR